MRRSVPRTSALVCLFGLAATLLPGCEPEYIPPLLGGGWSTAKAGADGQSGAFAAGSAFTDNLIQARTFTKGTSVTTVTYQLNALGAAEQIDAADVLLRKPFGIDFNSDGKIDPVVGYGEYQAVIQILLSDPDAPPGVVRFTSLTLDSKQDMKNLADVAVGDIDRDGNLDIVAAAEGAVWYFHHPSGQPTTAMAAWGNPDSNDELRERIDASYMMLSDAELLAIIAQAVGPGVNLDDYVVTIEQRYTNVEIGDIDNDGDNDIAASRSFVINLEPRPNAPVEGIQIVDGDVFVFINPGFATNGHNWRTISVGRHERQTRLDRDGADALLLYDLDGDGDLDIISAATKDNNVQVAWFENPVQNRFGAPGPSLAPDDVWQQWRIGSIRDVCGLDVADLTGDGRPDVVATGGAQMQMVLFEQPAAGPARSYDWDSYVLVTYQSFEPRDVKVLDVDNDGELELVTGGTNGAVRYYKRSGDPRGPWQAFVVHDYAATTDASQTGGGTSAGDAAAGTSAVDVGRLGYGDLDGDGDLDLVAVVSGEKDNDSRVAWIRNETIRLDAAGGE